MSSLHIRCFSTSASRWRLCASCTSSSEHAVSYVTAGTELEREAAYMLLSIVGELRIGTSPRPIMAARLIVPRNILTELGWAGPATPDGAAS